MILNYILKAIAENIKNSLKHLLLFMDTPCLIITLNTHFLT